MVGRADHNPRAAKPELASGELVEISPHISIPPTTMHVVYPTRSGQPAKVRAFVDALIAWGEKNA